MDQFQQAKKALQEWWQATPAPSFVRDLLEQDDRESVSMHDLREVMAYLLDRTDAIPHCTRGICIAPKQLLEPLREVMRLLTRVTIFVNPVQLITPDNAQEERRLFFDALKRGAVYNPTLRYEQAVSDLRQSLEKVPGVRSNDIWDGLLQKLGSMYEHLSLLTSDFNHPVMKIVLPLMHAKISDDIAALSLAKALEQNDAQAIQKALQAMYTCPSAQDVANAESLATLIRTHDTLLPWQLDQVISQTHPLYHLLLEDQASAEDLEKATGLCLAEYYRHTTPAWPEPLPVSLRYHIERNARYTAYDVRDKSSHGPTIGIPENPRSWIGILALCRHEIDMHVRQSFNGSLLYGFGGGLLKHNQEDLYEGTALYAERNYIGDLLGISQAPALPYATLAYQAACEGRSFYETFMMLKDLFPARISTAAKEKSAWNTTFRVFRSTLTTDGSSAYGCAKDTGYLRGAIAAYYLHMHDLGYLLDMGISPIEQLPVLRRLQRDVEPPYPDLRTADSILRNFFPSLPT